MPIEPVDPSKKTGGDGSEKYNAPKEKFGPSEYDKVAEKVNQEKERSDRAKAEASKMAEEHRAKVKAESPRTYTERLQDMGRLPSGGGGGGAGDTKFLKPKYKAGGMVKSASKRADGCCIRGKTRA
jgi:hypothetical protein